MAVSLKWQHGVFAKVTMVGVLTLCFIVVWSLFYSSSSSVTSQRESFTDIMLGLCVKGLVWIREGANKRYCMLDAIPENEPTEGQKDESLEDELQVAEYEEEYGNMYWSRTDFMDNEDGELSWFNAGVRVGVGIGLGICVRVGIVVGLLVRTYQPTTSNFRRRLF